MDNAIIKRFLADKPLRKTIVLAKRQLVNFVVSD